MISEPIYQVTPVFAPYVASPGLRQFFNGITQKSFNIYKTHRKNMPCSTCKECQRVALYFAG